MTTIILAIGFFIFVKVLIRANIEYRQFRATLSPEQLKQHDEETELYLSQW